MNIALRGKRYSRAARFGLRKIFDLTDSLLKRRGDGGRARRLEGLRSAQTELRPTSRRVEAFSDGVFAIVVTIMVFEIRIPDSFASAGNGPALEEFAAVLATYALSFFVIVNLWTSHHYLLFTVHSPSRSTIWYNNLLLFFVSLIPVVTRFLGMHPASSRATAAYGALGLACTGAFMLLRSHAARRSHNLLHRDIHLRVLKRTWLFLGIYAVSIPLAFVRPWLAWVCFVIVPPMLFLPIIQGQRRPTDAGAEQHSLERSCP